MNFFNWNLFSLPLTNLSTLVCFLFRSSKPLFIYWQWILITDGILNASVIASRNCSNTCGSCRTHHHNNGLFRVISLAEIVDQVFCIHNKTHTSCHFFLFSFLTSSRQCVSDFTQNNTYVIVRTNTLKPSLYIFPVFSSISGLFHHFKTRLILA